LADTRQVAMYMYGTHASSGLWNSISDQVTPQIWKVALHAHVRH